MNTEPHGSSSPAAQVVRRRSPVAYVTVSGLKLDPRRFQFKGDGDERGLVAGEELQGDYMELGTGSILVWEDAGGSLWVVDGHHRYDLARRTGKEDIPAQVLREADGVTEQGAIALGAESNIRNGCGTVKDYTRYFRNCPITLEEAGRKGLLAKEKGRMGWEIGKHASEGLYSWFLCNPGKAKVAAAIAGGAPDDSSLQETALRFHLDDGAGELEVGLYLRGIKTLPGRRQGYFQPDLFGMEDCLAWEKALAVSAAHKILEIRRYRDILRQAILKKGSLELTDEEAARWGITDKGNEAQITAAYDRVQRDLLEWESYRLHPEKLRELERTSRKAQRTTASAGVGASRLRRRSPTARTRRTQKPRKPLLPPSLFRVTIFHVHS